MALYNATCPPGNSLPEIDNIGSIPKNLRVFVIPGRNSSHPAMINCCAPNEVHVADGCFDWCEVPARLANESDGAALSILTNCLMINGRNLNDSNISTVRKAEGGRLQATLTTLWVWSLLIATYLASA
jgi:hypothetical protein